ncbi:hypothetical protein HDV05_005285 [Chytridiales sp. JEL 0842]|nr:hypothetical protein HDV05_005285 [Chytridiales sp. JEL 0842]
MELFRDITPVPQDDGPNPIVPIAYPEAYVKAMDIFRAVMISNERSHRVLELTEALIDINPAHYTVWKVRQDTLLQISADLRIELDYITKIAEENPKNYQIWHHRQIVVEQLGDASGEIAFVNSMIDLDSKNYHAWSYRQWVVRHFNLWDSELNDMNRLIEEDVRNNSAWNHRYYYFENRKEELAPEDLLSELRYSISKIRLAPNNESPWNYIRGLKKLSKTLLGDDQEVLQLAKSLNSSDNFVPQSYSYILDHLEDQIAVETDFAAKGKLVEEAAKVCAHLQENDTVRARFWAFRRSRLDRL